MDRSRHGLLEVYSWCCNDIAMLPPPFLPAPKVGDDGLVSEPLPISAALQCLPMEVGGLKKHTVVYSCLDATGQCLAVGSEQGYVWAVDLSTSRLLRELNVSWADSVSLWAAVSSRNMV